MDYVNGYPNQRRGQPQASTMLAANPYYQQPLLADPQYPGLTTQTYPQQPFQHQVPYQQPPQAQWQQSYASSAPRYSHSPQEPSRNSLSPTLLTPQSPDSYLGTTPSPRSSNQDWNPNWSTARESPTAGNEVPAWVAQTEFTWTAQSQPSPSTNGGHTPLDQRSVSDSNEVWASATAVGKRQRTNEKEKGKSGACKHCKRLKMKCTFDPPGAATCQRCRTSGQDCVVEGRKPRKNSEPLEQLAAQIEDKDEIINGLLRIVSQPQGEDAKPIDTAEVWRWIERGARSLMAPPSETPAGVVSDEEERLPSDSAPIGLLAELSLDDPEQEDKSTGKEKSGGIGGKSQGEEEEGVGVANAGYFKPGPMAHPELRRIIVERQMVPEILTLKVVTDEEVEHLFRIFHERIDAVIAIMDPVIHTVAGVKARCPFLFTVICAVAARYWVERPEMYTALMHHARAAAATAITDGWKSLEVCQAYLLLSVYPQPARSWAEDRAWLFLGCAIRLAMDLNLYKQGSRKFLNETHEREVLNRTRTWLICFNMDRALATKLGRPTTIPEDYIVRHSREWWRSSKYNGRLDVHLCFYTQLLRTVTRYFSLIYSDPESLSGFNENTEFGPITRAFDDEMEQFRQDAEHTYSTAPESRHPACLYRLALMPLAVSYYRLVMYSFGLEHAYRTALEPGNMFLIRSIDTASEVLRITNEELPIHEFHRYSPDGHWMWSVFAAAFLVKLAKPRLPQPPHLSMTPAQRESSLVLVQKFILTLELSAIDIRHTPALYARYLKRILGEPGNVTLSPSASAFGSPNPEHDRSQPVQPGLMAQAGGTRQRVAFSPGPSDAGPEEDLLAAMYSLEGDFWGNALLPGTWGMAGTGMGMGTTTR